MNEKGRLRLDFIIAASALVISLVAATAAVYQTHVIAQQFSATVWPYVSFDVTNSPWSAELDVRNDGLGPAIVRNVEITWDGKRVPSIEAVLVAIATANPQARRAVRAAIASGAKLTFSTSTPSAGMVIPANTKKLIIHLDGALGVRYFRPPLERATLALCYCSLTGNCWQVKYPQPNDSTPRSVGSCPVAVVAPGPKVPYDVPW